MAPSCLHPLVSDDRAQTHVPQSRAKAGSFFPQGEASTIVDFPSHQVRQRRLFYKPLCARHCAGFERAVVKHSLETDGEGRDLGKLRKQAWEGARREESTAEPGPAVGGEREAGKAGGAGGGGHREAGTSSWLPARGICPQLIFFCPVTAK